MIDDNTVASFLSHHGVKGQKWGIRNSKVGGGVKEIFKKAPKGDWKTRSKAQKLALITSGYFGAVAITPVDKLLGAVFNRTKSQPLKAAIGVIGIGTTALTSKLAVRFTRNVLQTDGKKKVKDISVGGNADSMSNKEMNETIRKGLENRTPKIKQLSPEDEKKYGSMINRKNTAEKALAEYRSKRGLTP